MAKVSFQVDQLDRGIQVVWNNLDQVGHYVLNDNCFLQLVNLDLLSPCKVDKLSFQQPLIWKLFIQVYDTPLFSLFKFVLPDVQFGTDDLARRELRLGCFPFLEQPLFDSFHVKGEVDFEATAVHILDVGRRPHTLKQASDHDG